MNRIKCKKKKENRIQKSFLTSHMRRTRNKYNSLPNIRHSRIHNCSRKYTLKTTVSTNPTR